MCDVCENGKVMELTGVVQLDADGQVVAVAFAIASDGMSDVETKQVMDSIIRVSQDGGLSEVVRVPTPEGVFPDLGQIFRV